MSGLVLAMIETVNLWTAGPAVPDYELDCWHGPTAAAEPVSAVFRSAFEIKLRRRGLIAIAVIKMDT